MIKLENIETYGWESAIRGMRNPMNSWDKSDSEYCNETIIACDDCPLAHETCEKYMSRPYIIGGNDLALMKKLAAAGTDHRKFMRMINVTMDITAPLYFWKEFDTYKVGTVRNSCSTMHKIAEKEFTLDDFSHEHLFGDTVYKEKVNDRIVRMDSRAYLSELVEGLNFAREMYLETKDKAWWWQMIQLLPSSYNQRTTVQLNYEVLANMYKSRKEHKLDEWREFCKEIEKLPYFMEVIVDDKS